MSPFLARIAVQYLGDLAGVVIDERRAVAVLTQDPRATIGIVVLERGAIPLRIADQVHPASVIVRIGERASARLDRLLAAIVIVVGVRDQLARRIFHIGHPADFIVRGRGPARGVPHHRAAAHVVVALRYPRAILVLAAGLFSGVVIDIRRPSPLAVDA